MEEPTKTQDDKRKFLIENQAVTAGAAGEKILKLIGTIDNLFPSIRHTPEEEENNAIAYDKLLQAVLQIFIECNVPLTYYADVWVGLKSVIGGLEQHMANHSTGLQKEIQSRTVGTKNPYSKKYDVSHATHNDLIQTILRLRESQGNVEGAQDYMDVNPDLEEPDSVVSPIQREDIKN